MARREILMFHISILLALVAVLAIAEDSKKAFAGRKDVRSARCEHHDHEEKLSSKWLSKFKKTKYGSSKSQHRPKSHYGQPNVHFRPPPLYVRTKTNHNTPPYNPPALSPPTSYPHSINPNAFPHHSYSPVQFYGSPPQVQSFNRPADTLLASTEAPVPPTYSNAPYPQDPEELEDSEELEEPEELEEHEEPEEPEEYSSPQPVINPSIPYTIPQVPVSSASYDPPSPNYLKIPDSDPPVNSAPAFTEAPINHTFSYSDTPYTQTSSISTATHESQDAAKPEKVSYSSATTSKEPTYDPFTYPSTVPTEGVAYSSPSHGDSESENLPVSVSSNKEPYPSSDFAQSYDPSPFVTEAPDYFPPSLSDDYSPSDDYQTYPEQPLSKPASYSPPKFPSYDAPSFSPFSFMEPPFFSPPSSYPFRKANNRPSAKTPEIYDGEDDKDEDEKGYFQNHYSFPKFDQFIQQVMRKGKK